jgi:2-oxoglutarate ferredoxin oxidoreductase subunit delta
MALPRGKSTSRAPVLARPAPIRGRVFIRRERCKGCQFCVTFCPQDVLAMSKELNAKGYHYPVVLKSECINCTGCLSICPDYAIMSIPATPKIPAPRSNP